MVVPQSTDITTQLIMFHSKAIYMNNKFDSSVRFKLAKTISNVSNLIQLYISQYNF